MMIETEKITTQRTRTVYERETIRERRGTRRTRMVVSSSDGSSPNQIYEENNDDRYWQSTEEQLYQAETEEDAPVDRTHLHSDQLYDVQTEEDEAIDQTHLDDDRAYEANTEVDEQDINGYDPEYQVATEHGIVNSSESQNNERGDSVYQMDTEDDNDQLIPKEKVESDENMPLADWIRRNKRVRENSSNEEDIPLDELRK